MRCARPALPLHTIARAYARLGRGQGNNTARSEAARRVVAAMQAHPWLIGGTDRFDTVIIENCNPAICCKGGAEGLECIALPLQGLGIALKVETGNSSVKPTIVYHILAQLQVVNRTALDKLSAYASPAVTNLHHEVVGQWEAVFQLTPV